MNYEMKHNKTLILCSKCNQGFRNVCYYWHPLKDDIYCKPCFPKVKTLEERAKEQWVCSNSYQPERLNEKTFN